MAWSWESLSADLFSRPRDFVARLNLRMKLLEGHLASTTMKLGADVTTTDGNATTLATIPVPVDHTHLVTGYVVARRTGGSSGAANDGAAYYLEVAAKNTAGTAAEIAAETLRVIGESQAGWTVASSASGGDILIRVTGAANNTVYWGWFPLTASVRS